MTLCFFSNSLWLNMCENQMWGHAIRFACAKLSCVQIEIFKKRIFKWNKINAQCQVCLN